MYPQRFEAILGSVDAVSGDLKDERFTPWVGKPPFYRRLCRCAATVLFFGRYLAAHARRLWTGALKRAQASERTARFFDLLGVADGHRHRLWIARQATPGKIAIGARIVDAATGDEPTRSQMIGRYFAYYVSTFPLCLGFIWVAFDRRKQGWHDKLAGTVVVRSRHRGPEPVKFRDL